MTKATQGSTRVHLRTAARRAGMTVVVVLGVISITLALSYAMLRSQVTSVEIQSNLERQNLARQAAYAGISAALRQMHLSTWTGVDATLTQELAGQQWYEVSFATGDASLTPSSADYKEYPFRVTIHSTGYAADPAQPDVRSSYSVEAVVELVRKKLSPAPTAWTFARNFTVYQWSANGSMIEVPLRVEGPMFMQGPMSVGTDYPADSNSRNRYYSDLTSMKNAGLGDYRPLSGPIVTPLIKQTTSTKTMLTSNQQVTLVDFPISTAAPVTIPTATGLTYRLYPGGKEYALPVLQATYGSTLTGVTLQPDPVSNPLGIYLSSGTLFLGSNTTVSGTIITSGSEPDIRITGQNVVLQASTLPMLEGSTVAVQLPVALVKDDFLLQADSRSTIRGVVVAWDEFAFERGDTALQCDLQGRAFCSRLLLYGRVAWDMPALSWASDLLFFDTQKLLSGGVQYFPDWIKAARGFDYKPLLTLKPNSTAIVDHWNNFTDPIYVAGDDDNGGLRWNLIGWTDNPQ